MISIKDKCDEVAEELGMKKNLVEYIYSTYWSSIRADYLSQPEDAKEGINLKGFLSFNLGADRLIRMIERQDQSDINYLRLLESLKDSYRYKVYTEYLKSKVMNERITKWFIDNGFTAEEEQLYNHVFMFPFLKQEDNNIVEITITADVVYVNTKKQYNNMMYAISLHGANGEYEVLQEGKILKEEEILDLINNYKLLINVKEDKSTPVQSEEKGS